MVSSGRLVAIAALLVGIAAWGVASPSARAQADEAAIVLTFETATGESPDDDVAVLDVNSGIEYRSDRVSQGDPIEVPAVVGIPSALQIRRTSLRPGDVTCKGPAAEATISGSRIVVTPGPDGAICDVTLTDEPPAAGDELPMTGVSLELALLGAIVIGQGAILAGASRTNKR